MRPATLLLFVLASTLPFIMIAHASILQQPFYDRSLGSFIIYKELTYNVTLITSIPLKTNANTAANSTTGATATNTSTPQVKMITHSYYLNYTIVSIRGTTISVKVTTNMPKNSSFVNNGTYEMNLLYSPLTPEFPMVIPQYLIPINWTNFTKLAEFTGYAGFLISGQNVSLNLVNPAFANSTYYALTAVSTAWKSATNYGLNDVKISLEGYLESASFSLNSSTTVKIVLVKALEPYVVPVNSSNNLKAASFPILYAVKTFNPFSHSLTVSGYLQAIIPYVINNYTYLLVYYPLEPSSVGYVSAPQQALGYPTYVFEKVVNVNVSPSYVIPNTGASEIKWSNTTMKLIKSENVSVAGKSYFAYVYNGIINGTQNVTIYVTKEGLIVKEYVFDIQKELPVLELDYLGPYYVSPTSQNPSVVSTGGPYTSLPYNVIDPKYFYMLTVIISVVIVIVAVIFRLR